MMFRVLRLNNQGVPSITAILVRALTFSNQSTLPSHHLVRWLQPLEHVLSEFSRIRRLMDISPFTCEVCNPVLVQKDMGLLRRPCAKKPGYDSFSVLSPKSAQWQLAT